MVGGRPKNESSSQQGRSSTAEVAITGTFSWDEYLQGSEQKPAPSSCFKQAVDIPANEFSIGMKMESKDPRNSMSYCIATVVYAKGPHCPRLCLRLDGSDNRNDFWSLVDSQDIHPYGWCEENGEQLQPPLGFSKNASYWPAFLTKLLQESKESMASKECFKPVPPGPVKNMFEVGMKLEAVDRKNPHLIGPATVGDIDGDKILVQFDGWKGAFDYWCPYNSRDIFPVGWCASTGHVLQPPGVKGHLAPKSRRSSTSKSQSVSPNIAVHVDTPAQTSANEATASPGSKSAGSSKKHSPPLGKLISPASLSPGNIDTGNTVTAFLNQSCTCGSMLSKGNIGRLPLQYRSSNAQRTLRKVVVALLECAPRVEPVLEVINQITEQTDPQAQTHTVKVIDKFFSAKLATNVNTEASLEQFIKSLLNSLHCCANLFSIGSHKLCQDCLKVEVADAPSCEILKRSQSMIDPITSPPTTKRAKLKSDGSIKKGRVGRPPRQPTSSLIRIEPQPKPEHPINNNNNNDSLYALPTNPNQWNINDVIQYVKSSDPSLAKYASLLQTHEIDGPAFMLMTSDIAIKYMEMKVGPALKLCHLIDTVRGRTSNGTHSGY